jgi:hypothetical protein
MLDLLMDRATDEWSRWFPGEAAPDLSPMLLAGGPAHRDRISVLLFPNGARSPQVIMKIGFTPREGEFLTSEFEAMDQLWPQLPVDLRTSMPRALDLHRIGGTTALAAGILTGNRLLVPGLTGEVPPKARAIMDSFFRRSFLFARALAAATSSPAPQDSQPLAAIPEDFARRFLAGQPEFEGRVLDFAGAVSAASIEWHPAWQHQDVAVGNVLDDRGHLRFVDWEHASGGCVPWFDIAFAPVVTSHLARRVDRIPSVETAALGVLGAETAIGTMLRERMEEIWDYPLPLSWGVTLTAMEGAMRRLDDGREGSPEWVELVRLMMCDEEFRKRVDWLVPEW